MITLIVPPFADPEFAVKKVQIAENLWNARDPGQRRSRLHGGHPMAKPRWYSASVWNCVISDTFALLPSTEVSRPPQGS